MNLAMTRAYARSPRGTRALGNRPLKKGKNLTLIGALAFKGILGAMTITGGTSGDVFRVFIEKILLPELWPGAIVVMDNLPAHKVSGIPELIASVGASVLYLSPYSPEFNPIENLWSKLKTYLRAIKPRTEEALQTAIAEGLDLITLQDIEHWFTHCCYFSAIAP